MVPNTMLLMSFCIQKEVSLHDLVLRLYNHPPNICPLLHSVFIESLYPLKPYHRLMPCILDIITYFYIAFRVSDSSIIFTIRYSIVDPSMTSCWMFEQQSLK